MGNYKGRIIFLGDGTEVLTASDDTEMLDKAEEDKDLVSQVARNNDPPLDSSSAPAPAQGATPVHKSSPDHDKAEAKQVDGNTEAPAGTMGDVASSATKEAAAGQTQQAVAKTAADGDGDVNMAKRE